MVVVTYRKRGDDMRRLRGSRYTCMRGSRYTCTLNVPIGREELIGGACAGHSEMEPEHRRLVPNQLVHALFNKRVPYEDLVADACTHDYLHQYANVRNLCYQATLYM
jgi:hypothetical protein